MTIILDLDFVRFLLTVALMSEHSGVGIGIGMQSGIENIENAWKQILYTNLRWAFLDASNASL